MQDFFKRIIELEKALHAMVMQVENQFLTDESQVDISRFKCPLLLPEPDIHFKGDKIELIRVLLSLCFLGHLWIAKVSRCRIVKCFRYSGNGWISI